MESKPTGIVVLEWTFSPPDYFEETFTIRGDGYPMTIGSGRVEARVDPVAYNHDPGMRGVLHEALAHRFLGVQLLTHSPFDLSKASLYRVDADGRKHVTLFAESGTSSTMFGTLDIVVKDEDGNVIRDSRRERIEQKKEVAARMANYLPQDKVLARMAASYEQAVTDSDNELVHLYEIRDALSEKFRGVSMPAWAPKAMKMSRLWGRTR